MDGHGHLWSAKTETEPWARQFGPGFDIVRQGSTRVVWDRFRSLTNDCRGLPHDRTWPAIHRLGWPMASGGQPWLPWGPKVVGSDQTQLHTFTGNVPLAALRIPIGAGGQLRGLSKFLALNPPIGGRMVWLHHLACWLNNLWHNSYAL